MMKHLCNFLPVRIDKAVKWKLNNITGLTILVVPPAAFALQDPKPVLTVKFGNYVGGNKIGLRLWCRHRQLLRSCIAQLEVGQIGKQLTYIFGSLFNTLPCMHTPIFGAPISGTS